MTAPSLVRLLAAVALPTVLAGCATMQRGGAAPGEGLIMPFVFEDGRPVWTVGYTSESGSVRITEFVRPGQNVETWTELVTVQNFLLARGVPALGDMLDAHRSDLQGRCPGSTLDIIEERPGDIMYASRVTGCAQGEDEVVLARAMDGTNNRFVVQYAVRGAVSMTDARRAAWLAHLRGVRITTMN